MVMLTRATLLFARLSLAGSCFAGPITNVLTEPATQITSEVTNTGGNQIHEGARPTCMTAIQTPPGTRRFEIRAPAAAETFTSPSFTPFRHRRPSRK